MKKQLVSISMLLMLLLSTMPLILNVKPVEASVTGPSLIVNDAANQIYATLGATAGSKVTVKGTVTNVGGSPPAPWLTGVFYRENVGPGIIPADLTFLWSLDGITWWPAGPVVCPTLYPGYQLELIVGAPNYYLLPGFSSTTYIKTIVNRPAGIGPTDIEVIVFEDWDLSQSYTPGDVIISVGDWPVKIDLTIWNTAELDPASFFDTIQAAVNAATPGQTIYAYEGTYDEQVVINTSLTLQGTGNTTIIQPSGTDKLTSL